MATLLIKNIGTLQTPIGSFAHKGRQQGENRKLHQAAILAEDGIIKVITADGTLPCSEAEADTVIDAEGNLVTPGLVDGHTHMVFGGYRQNEIPLKLKGAGYLDILRAGGGINDTVQKTRAASFEALYAKTEGFLDEMLELGVTTCEAKSGYGIDLETEVKLLEVLKALDQNHPMDVVSTFMPAHVVLADWKGREDEFIQLCIDEMMPYVKEHELAEFIDIFTEDSVFDAAQSRRYLEAARDLGFGLKIHADEIKAIGGSVLAGELGATSAEHLIVCPPACIEAMAKGGVIACLLPATSFNLGAVFAPARDMVNAGVPVAMATDFNPGSCPCLNMQFVINLGCLKYRLTPEELLTAVTLNGAAAIDMADKVGTVEAGKLGDLVIWDAPDLDYICYRFGSNLAKKVIKRGRVM